MKDFLDFLKSLLPFLVVGSLFGIACLGVSIVVLREIADERAACETAGGTLVDSSQGRICIEARKIPSWSQTVRRAP